MVSFDVRSLFTSVPTNDAMHAIKDFVDDDTALRERTGVSKAGLIKLIELCLSATHFQFRNEFYCLTDGLPMGSPASQTIANMFMMKLEQTALQSFSHPKYGSGSWTTSFRL